MVNGRSSTRTRTSTTSSSLRRHCSRRNCTSSPRARRTSRRPSRTSRSRADGCPAATTIGPTSCGLRKTPVEHDRDEQRHVAAVCPERTSPTFVGAVGAEQPVIGADSGHPEGMCPFTMKVADGDDLGGDVRRKILYDNPKRRDRL